ncbi:hypothetical protein EG327_001071 [Venturia inaequalis]|uniref:Uncharacterized protein n=1 Tax=Venturia inaequalis TaxID=5025 RepID=A0A8H3VLM2_VENIN|nr:hypothetical protein EG327_001071 [Venturia inaequalis]
MPVARPATFFRLPTELRIIIYHMYILNSSSTLCNPRKTIYEGAGLLNSDEHKIERAQTYIHNDFHQGGLYRTAGPALFRIPLKELDKAFARSLSLNELVFHSNFHQASLYRIAGPTLFGIPSNELDKAFARCPLLNEHVFHITPENISSLEKWEPPFPITDYTRICLAVNLYTRESEKKWKEQFETTFPRQFTALQHIHIYFEEITTEQDWHTRTRTTSTKNDLQESLMEMPSVQTVTVSWGAGVDRAPKEQFAYYRVTGDCACDPFLYYYCDGLKSGFKEWVTHDDPCFSKLFPGQAYDWRQREMDRLEYAG